MLESRGHSMRSAWKVAAVVGTLINVYGQMLVPWLNGEPNVLAALRERALLHPGTTALSVAVAYLFPLGVSVYSAAVARNPKR